MTKRIFSVLLVTALLATMLVAPVDAWSAREDVTPMSQACPCGCGATLDGVDWMPWDPNNTTVISSGHYYLAGDYQQLAQEEIISGNRVVLDLRGHTLTTGGLGEEEGDEYHRLFLLRGYLAVLDTVGGGLFSAKTSGAGFGGIVSVSANETNDPTLELYSGTIAPDHLNKGSKRGGLISLSENATFRMYGGRVMGGTTVINSADTNYPGGNIVAYHASARLEVLGGEIIGGEASSHGGNIYSMGTTVLKNCRIVGGIAGYSGGNICQNGGSLTIENCVISDGVSNHATANGGGNICIFNAATVSVKDSTIRNGYAANHGGNCLFTAGTQNIENTRIYAGVSANGAGNLHVYSGVTATTISGGEIAGDFTCSSTGLKLTGAVKIGLLNNGLNLLATSGAKTVDTSGLTEGAEIYVNAEGLFTDAAANIDYFKGALRTVIAQTEDGLVATQAASGEVGGYCPHCNQQVAWSEFSLTGSVVQNCLYDSSTDTDPTCTGRHMETGHYYLTADDLSFKQHYASVFLGSTQASKDVVIDLAGYDLTSTSRVFYINPANTSADIGKSSLTLLDSQGGAVVTGSGSNNQGGGVIYNEGSDLTIYGGKYVYTPSGTRNVTNGGVVFNGGTFRMHGGILDGSAYVYTVQTYEASDGTVKTPTYTGAALYTATGTAKVIEITAGRLVGGNAQTGGAVYFGTLKEVSVTGGQFYGGSVDSTLTDCGGGAVRLSGSSSSKKGSATFSECSFYGGNMAADKGAGNLSTTNYAVTLNDCYMAKGTSAGYGGNVVAGTGGTIDATDTIIWGGYSTAQSGNIHVASTNSHLVLTNCLVTYGSASKAGNLNAGNGYITISGGEISFGKARSSTGGNIIANAGNYSATCDQNTVIQADDQGNLPLIAGGTAETLGGNIYVSGVLYLKAAKIHSGSAGTNGQDIYLPKASKQGKLEIGSDVAGDMYMGVATTLLGSGIYGQTITNTLSSQVNAKIHLEGDPYDAHILAKDGMLCVGAATVIDGMGNITWYTDNAAAISDCGSSEYVKIYTTEDVVLTKDCAVDINGMQVNVSGAYTLNGMDSVGSGKVTTAADTTVSVDFDAPDGVRYLGIGDGTFHPLTMKITGVSLRPSADGIYYTGLWDCDETVAGMIASYGVAVSLGGYPGTDFAAPNSGCLYTAFTAFENGTPKTSAMIQGIMKSEGRTAELNNTYGTMPIYAKAYITLTDGTTLVSNDNIAYSLYDVMAKIDGLIESDPHNYRKHTLPMRSFYEKWVDMGMGTWDFNKIPEPEDDGVIDVLMIGNSFCFYYVEELYAMAKAAGIPMRVCNVYYSGCKMSQHWTWWKNGNANYQFIEVMEDGKTVRQYSKSLEWCLAQDDWDVISLQEGSSVCRSTPAPTVLANNYTYYSELLSYIKTQFPNARHFWQQTWAYQVGYKRDGDSYTVPDAATQLAAHENVRALSLLVCQEFGWERMPSGDAWKIVRDNGYDKLCSRLGKTFYGEVNGGDYYHDGDWGGGQYLNACVWFEMITGQSCLDNTYVPSYVYDGVTYELHEDITVTDLKNAAHQAVETYRADPNS